MKQFATLKVFVFLGTQISKKAISNDENHQGNITGCPDEEGNISAGCK